MKKTLRLFLFLFLLVNLLIPLYSQQKSRVAVLPFDGLDVAKTEAQVVTNLFETALVKTGVYDIIEQNQIEAIMDAQSFSLSGCTDDACAVEVGKLLSAEIIVIGSLSRVGSRYIANAKLIDVALGKNVNADTVSADDLAKMTDEAINLLAYKLAGLTYSQGGTAQIASSFGELFVSTEPKGAEIFVNGMRRGKSPLVIEKVPFGQVHITARKDNMVAEETVNVESSDLLELDMKLHVSLGRLFVKSSEPDVTVYLGSKKLGPLESGLFRDLPSGTHKLELRGDGLLAEEEVIIEEDKTVTVEVYPSAIGSLQVSFPGGAAARLTGRTTDQAVRSGTPVTLLAGDYSLSVTGIDYEPYEEKITIARGSFLYKEIKLNFTQEYLDRKTREEAYADLTDRLNDLKRLSEGSEKVETADALLSEIAASGYDFSDLDEEAVVILTDSLKQRIDTLNSLIHESEAKTLSNRQTSTISFITAAACIITGGVFTTLGIFEYETYQTEPSTPTTEASRDKLELYSIAQIAGYSLGGAGGVLGLLLLGEDKDLPVYQAELDQRSTRLAELNGGW